MLKIHIYGKSHGCSKCDALKRKVTNILGDDARFREAFGVQFHDVLTEEGIADFCLTNINPNCVPGIVIGGDAGFLPSRCTSDEWLADGALLRPWLGRFTDYGDRHRGVISSEEIRALLTAALEIAGKSWLCPKEVLHFLIHTLYLLEINPCQPCSPPFRHHDHSRASLSLQVTFG